VKLLFVSHSLPPFGRPLDNIGGMQRAAIDLHDGLIANQSVEVTPLVLRSAWNERGIRTPLFLGRALRTIRRMAKAREMDAVLFSSMVTAILAIPLRNLLHRNGIASAAIVNGLDATTPTWPYPKLVRKAFESLDLVLPISNATRNACLQRGLTDDKAKVVSLGIRLDRFSTSGDKPAARRRMLQIFGIDSSPSLILCSVGRLVPRKGVEWLVSNVMTDLPRDVMLLVVGEGPERQKIQKAIDAHHLEDRVHLLGAVSDSQLEAVYQGSDIFVMPNVKVAHDMEGFGLVMLEAGLLGLPVIASNMEGITDVITPGENGELVESLDASTFRDSVMKYYVDRQRLRAASHRARMHVVSRFGWTGVVQRYLDELRGVTAS
jgi:phosphatidylinositol alpha-1,6-mannosyltransferase